MNSFNYEGCEVNILNKSSLITNQKAYEFCESYIDYYLSIEGCYIPEAIKNKETINIVITNNKKQIIISLNNIKHILLNIEGYHNVKTNHEVMSRAHDSFFQQILYHKVSGTDIIERYPI